MIRYTLGVVVGNKGIYYTVTDSVKFRGIGYRVLVENV